MNDLTILYYSDNSLPDAFAAAVRGTLATAAEIGGGIPIVSVTQKPIQFGYNFLHNPVERSYRAILEQIRTGCWVCGTEFVALCEHDVIYPPEHFTLRPVPGYDVVFDQNRHRALLDRGVYTPNVGGRSMQLVIARRTALIGDLNRKLIGLGRHDADFHGCFEPGKGDVARGIPPLDYERQWAGGPGILDLCNHGGNYAPRKPAHPDRDVTTLAPWGAIAELAERYHIDLPRKEAAV